MPANDLNVLLKLTVDLWRRQIDACKSRKARDFGNAAAEVMKYVGRRFDPIRIRDMINGAPIGATRDDGTEYQTVLNWTQAFVDVMTPYVYNKIPNRLVSPIRPQLPPEIAKLRPDIAEQQKQNDLADRLVAFELQWFLNWSPRVYDAKHEGRLVVQEALAKGRGCAWVEMDDSPIAKPDGSRYQIPTMRADSVDNLQIDADAKQLRDAGYIVRQRLQSAYVVADIYGEDADELRAKAKLSSPSSAQESVTQYDGFSGNGDTKAPNDLLTYYEVWSRIGLGTKLVAAPDDLKKNAIFVAALDKIGPFVHFAILPGMDRPLGLDPVKLTAMATQVDLAPPTKKPSDDTATEDSKQSGDLTNDKLVNLMQVALDWPIKTYGNPAHPWPLACLDFESNINNPWARPKLEAALPIQKFLDSVYYNIMQRVRKAGRDILIYSNEIEESITAALNGLNDLPMVGVDGNVSKETMERLIHIFSFPEMNKDIFHVLEVCGDVFREVTGLDPSMFGGIPRSQDRSAQASSMRGAGLSRRPDDYAESVESWSSLCSSIEGVAARQLVDYGLIANLFGESAGLPQVTDPSQPADPMNSQADQPQWANMPLTQTWMELIYTQDPYRSTSEINYEIENGSGKRKNKQLLQENATQMFQMFGQQAFTLSMETGDMEPLVVLYRLVGDAFDMPMEVFLDSLVQAVQQKMLAAQQEQAIDNPQANGPPSPGGGTPAEAGETQPGMGKAVGAWARAAGGPIGPRIGAPPETSM